MRVGAFFGLLSGAINWLGELGLPRLGPAPERDIVRGSPSDSEVLREALDMLPQGVVLLDPDGRYIFWNRRYADIYSGSADLFEVGVRLEDTLRVGIARGEYPEASGREEAWLGERMARMRNPAGKIEQKLADGRWILIDERRTSDGGFIGLRVDITDIKAREQSFRLLFDANPVPMFVVSAADERILAVNDAALNHYGFGRATMMGALFNMIEWPGAAAAPEPDRSDEAAQSWTSRHRTASEDAIDVTLFSRPLDYAGESARLIAAFDVTDRNRAEAKAAYLAHHDQLTGLANRAYLHLRLRELFGRGAVAPSVAILLIDLDRFKLINDTHGHFGGDKLLREAAQRIRGALSEQDFVARLGGDEFAVVTGITDVDDLGRLADALIEALSTSYRLDDHEASIGASIGIAIGPNDGGDPERLMRCADLALYRAKAEGRGAYHYFEAAMDARLQDRRSMEVDLAAALDKSELQVFYQPLVALRTGEISAFEALARWRHPTRGDVPPSVFIPIAEETDLICKVGTYVLERACADAARWPAPIKIAVNLSPRQFRSGGLLAAVQTALRQSGLPASRLELEITEAMLLERTELVQSTLHALRALGVRISMDDFGTGYSSLSYLRSFPFDKIKIDRSFVQEMATSADAAAIVRTIVNLGASLGIQVTAEGIETAEAAQLLAAQGCTEGQGFFFSQPRPRMEADALVAQGGFKAEPAPCYAEAG
jgi:diguanylate cyclase (GGDEF)-like protein/PAS domain S-box-containing protein